MVVVGPGREDEVGFPFPDLPDDLLRGLQRGQQLAVVVVEDDVVDADATAGFMASARRRMASWPPPCSWWPASPLVTETKRTLAPAATHLAATPPARMSQSSGCAPKAMMRKGSSAPSGADSRADDSTSRHDHNQRDMESSGRRILHRRVGEAIGRVAVRMNGLGDSARSTVERSGPQFTARGAAVVCLRGNPGVSRGET